MVEAWQSRRLAEAARLAAVAGDKAALDRANEQIEQWNDLLEGDPRFRSDEDLRETWGTGQAAEQGTAALLAVAGGPAGYLD